MNPKIFGWEHFTYLGIMTAITVAGIILIKKFIKNEKTKIIILKIMAGILLVSILSNRISIIFKNEPYTWYSIIPDSFCGMSSLVLSTAVLFGKKDNPVLHFVWFVALLGGSITMVYPDFIGQSTSIFYPATITGLLHHTLSIMVVILVFIFDYIRVTYKKWHYTVFGFTCYLTLGAFLISVFDTGDAFHIMSPLLSGTPLTAWFIAPIYLVIYGLILLVFELVRKRKITSSTTIKKEK